MDREAEISQLRERVRDLEERPDREHVTELNPSGADKLRAWLARPDGSLTLGRVTFEAVAGGGISVRTWPYRSST